MISCRKLTSSIAVSVLLTATVGCAHYSTETPPPGALKDGQVSYVDDGSCPPGQIKRVTGADAQMGTRRHAECVRR